MFDQEMAKKAAENLGAVRKKRPLVHNITNYVVMNYTANALLACGASPVMAHAVEEVEEMVSLAGALVLNIGTLSPPWIEAMLKAGKRANALRIPVILDPVGAGATRLRTDSAKRLIEGISIQVIVNPEKSILTCFGILSRHCMKCSRLKRLAPWVCLYRPTKRSWGHTLQALGHPTEVVISIVSRMAEGVFIDCTQGSKSFPQPVA